MNSPAAIVAALKQSPRGQLIYERQPFSASVSPISREAASSSMHNVSLSGNDAEVSTLAGSLADVSSVLEDVSMELSEIQLRRVASIINRLNRSSQLSAKSDKSSEDEEEEAPVTPSIVRLETVKKFTPVFERTEDALSPSVDDVMSIVGRELLKLEAERKLKIDAKMKERQLKLTARNEEQRRRSLLEMENVRKSVELELSLIEAKEKEAEANFCSRSNDDILHQQEMAARKAREAQIEAELLKAKQLENAKKEKLRRLQDEVEQHSKSLSELLEPLIIVVDSAQIDAALQSYGFSLETLPGFIQSASSCGDPNNALIVMKELYSMLTMLINEATSRAEKEAIEKSRRENEAEQEKLKKQLLEQQQRQQAEPEQEPPAKVASIPAFQGPDISSANAEILKNVLAFRDNYVKELNQMTVPKDFKFTCQKAVTTPLNAISDVTTEHLKDKLNKLTALTNGQPVQATDTVRFQANSLPEMIYAKNHLAKKLVNHGEEVVASKPKNAFAPAIIVVAIWSNHQDFGQAFLAYLYETCPFLVPKYPQKTASTSEIDYLKSLGYMIGLDGIAEDKTMFLKRVSGLTRLYAAITISRLPENKATAHDHPHGLGNIWRLLASTLNLQPLNDITATVLYDILSVTGAFMFEKYGSMFEKLLTVLATDYFQKITSVTEEGCGGPLARLELFLQKAIAAQTIEKPEGLLRADFL